MKLRLRCLLALLALSVSSLFAQVTVTVTGTIIEAVGPGNVPDAGPFVSAFPLGTAFTATFTYDSSAVDVYPLVNNNRAYYYNDLSVSAATYSANGYTFSAFGTTSIMEVYNDDASYYGAPIDGFNLNFPGDLSTQAGGFRPSGFYLGMMDDNLSLFDDDSLANITSETWELDDFQSTRPYISIRFVEGGLYGYASSFSFSTAAIPEPSTYAAFAGLGALGFVVWRRRRLAT